MTQWTSRLPQALKQWSKRPVRRALRSAGYELVARDLDPFLLTAELIRSRRIETVVDVGANQGQYAEHLRSTGFAGSVLSFEPGRVAFEKLQRASYTDPKWHVHRMALGEVEATMELKIAANSVSSSLLDVGTHHVAAAPASAVVSTETVRVARLDDVLAGVPGPLMLKIDTQGFELPVLRGAAALLEEVEIVQAELSLVELYAGQSSYLEVLGHLEDRSFRPHQFIPGFANPSTGQLLQVDVVACRQLT